MVRRFSMHIERKWFVIFTFLLNILLLPVVNASPLHEQTLRDYIEHHFGATLALSSQEFSQILWLGQTTSQSPDKIPGIGSYPLDKEVIRLLNRLHNLALLRDGSEASYQHFIKPQREKNYDLPVLHRTEFDVLSRWFRPKALSEDRYSTLKAAIIISAVARTRFARERAQQVWDSEGLGYLPEDGMAFLWATSSQENTIYPLMETLSEDQKVLFHTALLPDSHLRHMLYAEGSSTMFYRLIDTIQETKNNPAFSMDTFNFWFMTWVIDISGFWVNPAIPEGSYYLNRFEAQNIIMQWHLLNNALFNQATTQPRMVIAQELLTQYLIYRAKALHLPNIPDDDILTYGGLASLLRIHTPAQAENLHEAYSQLSPEKQTALRKIYKDKLVGNPPKTPTYLPAVFVNLFEMKGSFQNSFELFIDIYIQSMTLIKAKYNNAELTINEPVSFKELANTTEVITEMKTVSVKLVGNDILPDTDITDIKANTLSIKSIISL